MNGPSRYQRQFGKREIEETPLALGSVFGIRAWSLEVVEHQPMRFLNGLLMRNGRERESTKIETTLVGNARYAWHDGPNIAHCGRGTVVLRQADVGLDCTCGFYAYWSLDDLGKHGQIPSNGSAVIGVIEGYGNTVIGPYGFRSQKAKIRAVAPFDASLGAYTTSGGFMINWRDVAHDRAALIKEAYPEVETYDFIYDMTEAWPLTKGPMRPIMNYAAMLSQALGQGMIDIHESFKAALKTLGEKMKGQEP